MISEFFLALFKAGLPVGLCSYGLAWWALKKNYVTPVSSIKGFEQAVKTRRKDKKLKGEGDAVHRKWLKFGGGFYGVVALLTYAVVELGEIRDFVMRLGGFFELIKNISLNLLINLLIGAFKNFIVAIAWPVFWMSEVHSGRIWLWFIAAYLGYWVGVRIAVGQFESENSAEN